MSEEDIRSEYYEQRNDMISTWNTSDHPADQIFEVGYQSVKGIGILILNDIPSTTNETTQIML